MRVLRQNELSRMTRAELNVTLRRIASEFAFLPEGSAELRLAQANLMNIRSTLASRRPGFGPA